MMGELGGQALVRKAVPVSLTLGIQAMGQLHPATEEQQFLVTGVSISIGPPLDRGCFCHK